MDSLTIDQRRFFNVAVAAGFVSGAELVEIATTRGDFALMAQDVLRLIPDPNEMSDEARGAFFEMGDMLDLIFEPT